MPVTTYVAFLRAVNVGGTGKLPMADLRVLCEEAGFGNAQTYIASGNVVLTSMKSANSVKSDLESALRDYAKKEVGVLVRSAAEIEKILSNNPFPNEKPSYTMAILLDNKPPGNALDVVTGQHDERLVLGSREVYVHYASGMGRSKLKIPAAKEGTARNMNTIRKMVELSQKATKA